MYPVCLRVALACNAKNLYCARYVSSLKTAQRGLLLDGYAAGASVKYWPMPMSASARRHVDSHESQTNCNLFKYYNEENVSNLDCINSRLPSGSRDGIINGRSFRGFTDTAGIICSAPSQYSIPLLQYAPQRMFHVSPRRDLHPLILLIIKPAAKVASIISGRVFRNWWKRQSSDEKERFKAGLIERRHYFLMAFGLLLGVSVVHYYTHIQVTPVTHRKRYISLTPEQYRKFSQFEYEMQFAASKSNIVATNSPIYKHIAGIVQRIVNSNQDLEFMREQNWTIIVVDNPEENAFVIPTGHIFVFSGLLKVTESEQQLAVILGHEIAHALLGHGAEQMSYAAVLDVVIIIVMAAIWAFMPTDGIAIVTQWFYDKLMQIMLHLPYSRKLEQEADEVGLQLIAKACYDVRESSVFWSCMDLRNKMSETPVDTPQWLSTHPNNDTRANRLDELIPQAIKLRASCNCPSLPRKDPRESLEYLRKQLGEKNLPKSSAVRDGFRHAGPLVNKT